MKEKYYGVKWGRMEFMLMNTSEKSIELNVLLEHKEDYDADGDYVNLKLCENNIYDLRAFLFAAYLYLKDN